MGHKQVLEWLTRAIETDRPDATEEAEKFLEYSARRSGLLTPRRPEQFAFVHLTFQEYFAAWHLRGLLRRFEKLAAMCAERVASEDWHEALVLLFELLAEFPGAGDDLVDELQQRTRNQETLRSTAALFAELLLDDQSGLSLRKQEQMTHFALAVACTNYSQRVVDRLQRLSSERFDRLVRPWLDRQLDAASPEELGQKFFSTATTFFAYRKDWLEKLARWVAKKGALAWSAQQILDAVATGGHDPEVCAWAVERLSLIGWLCDDRHMIGVADLCLPSLLLLQERSPRHRLFAQLSAVHAVSRSHILRYLYLPLPERREPPEGFRARTLVGDWDQPRAPVQVETLRWNWVLTRSLALFMALHLDWVPVRDSASAVALAKVLSEIFAANASPSPPEWLLQITGLATDMALTEWLFGVPDYPEDIVQRHLDVLKGLSSAPDEWTRLLGLTSLMLLGEGTPQRCQERNALLDRGTQQPASFTFPRDVQEVTQTAAFDTELPLLLRHIFLHRPGEPWLQPEWFDPAHPAARFFRVRPREFFARAAEVLDPEGQTELARWRETSTS